jgi:thioredoxin-related protein
MVTKEGSLATEGKGIHWTTGLSWEQIKQKAKAENKYIFIDAYTTWCGPCKMMDKYVYPNDTVSDFFNQHFIAVKAQMDQTDRDEQIIKNWYYDAQSIEREYAVTAYPSLIFLSPQSTMLYKIVGYTPVQEFVDTAKLVLTNGTFYNDPFKEYRALLNEYKQGIKHYDRMPYMITEAGKLRDTALARQLFQEHLNYAYTLNENERYTKENIRLWSSYVLKLDSKALQFFLKDYSIIDQIMGEKGWSTGVVDATIQGRIVDSFFRMQKGETITATGAKISNSEIMFMRLPVRKDKKIKPDLVEADWKTLKKMIREHFSEEFSTRNVFAAKIRWYWKHENMAGVSRTYFNQLEKYPPVDFTKENDMINEMCWRTFLYVNDWKLLKKALGWMDKVIKHKPDEPDKLDTYANLLYKLGNTKEAIEWEERAVNSQTIRYGQGKENEFKPTVEKMKKGEPTYQEEGAIWPKAKYF